MWRVVYLDEAAAERAKLPAREQVALQHAVEKLRSVGPLLPAPHSSSVVSGDRLRELRLRAGRSATRAFYRQVGEVIVIAAVGPEAQHDRRGFDRAVRAAADRLDQLED